MSATPVREVMGMRPLFVILGPLLLLCAQVSSADEIPDDSVITLQHHTCERHCAVYKVVLFGDGTVIYYGQYYVRRKGLVLGSVDREVSTSITVGGQSHGIIHHQRCGSPITKQLTEFEIEIERLANIAQFIK